MTALLIFSLFLNLMDIVFRVTLYLKAASFLDKPFSVSLRALYFSCKDFVEIFCFGGCDIAKISYKTRGRLHQESTFSTAN